MRHNRIQPLLTVIAIRLCRTAHAIFSPKFWNDKTNFTRVFVTVSPRRPWDRGWYLQTNLSTLLQSIHRNRNLTKLTIEQVKQLHTQSLDYLKLPFKSIGW